jgi:hypothetical protein
MQGTSNELITTTLREHGAVEEGVRLFDVDGAHLLAYATLLSSRRDRDGDLDALCGVYEWQQQPLAFLVDGQLIGNKEQLLRVRRRLAMRGGAPYLCVIVAGQLTVYRVGLDSASMKSAKLALPAETPTSQVLPYLSNVRPGLVARRRWIEQVVLSLLDEAITGLITGCNVTCADAISLVGRALFVRFLADRGLLTDDDAMHIAGVPTESLFDASGAAISINRWLDETFNGDLLPLQDRSFAGLPRSGLRILGNILHKAPGGQQLLDWEESWSYLDFAYIPVGVLSQAYEHYLRVHATQTQEREGGFYTPAMIAQMMLRGSIHALQSEHRAHSARVLDPAAGAGVFLITAYRQLVAERWAHDGQRPTTTVLRRILYEQIVGFDVNEEALRFAALGLYLMAIELDPHPRPVEKLRFDKNLRGRVLFKVGEHGSAGSLGRGVDTFHDGRYDLVIGNPPWSSSTGLSEWPQVREIVRDVASDRLRNTGMEPVLPNEVMDLPFVWRAMRWCRSGGQIAFALHARLLFQQGDGMPEARNAIFSALDITGVVNGADLRNSRVWPDVAAPFCLLFARNQKPSAASSFRYVSPRREDRLNAAGAFRLDAANAPQLTPTQVIEQPEILKILYRGGPLDLEVLGRMKLRQAMSVDEYWRRFGEADGKAAWSGSGYQRLRPSSPISRMDGLPGQACSHLIGMPHLVDMRRLLTTLDASELPVFDQSRLHRARSHNLFKGPMLVVHQSPPAHSGRLNVAVCDEDLVFTESFYGYSAHDHANGELLVRFMALVIGSKPALWYSLLTSGKFGVEREVVEKSTIDAMCVPVFDSFNRAELKTVRRLFELLGSRGNGSSDSAWAEVDAWVAKLYGFRQSDIEVIADTLTFNAPFASSREAAQRRPAQRQVSQFLETLETTLNPMALRYGTQLDTHQIRLPYEQPWLLFKLATKQVLAPIHDIDIVPILDMADQLGTTEVIAPLDDGGLLVARLDQSRYWASTQARLLARRVVWEHRQHLFGSNQ